MCPGLAGLGAASDRHVELGSAAPDGPSQTSMARPKRFALSSRSDRERQTGQKIICD